jgi:regulator of sirC expression with transglutaminase-like and TPR domain
MTAPFRIVTTTALALLLSSPLAFAQRGGGSMHAGDSFKEKKVAEWRGNAQVSGKVTDEAGKGVNEARVTFIFAKSNDGFFATTKKSGEFSAKDIKAGDWRVQIDAPNFITVRQPLTITDSKNAPINVQLKRDNSPELIAKAEGLFKEGKNAEARAEYLTVLAAHPELTGINRAIAFTYGREKNHPEALKYLDLALASNPDDTTLLQLAAASAMETGEYPRAMKYLAAIDVAALPDPEALLNAALNMLNRQRSVDGTTLLNRVIERFPDTAEAYFYRAYASLQLNKPADAKADLEKYLALAPSGPQAAKAKELLSSIK